MTTGKVSRQPTCAAFVLVACVLVGAQQAAAVSPELRVAILMRMLAYDTALKSRAGDLVTVAVVVKPGAAEDKEALAESHWTGSRQLAMFLFFEKKKKNIYFVVFNQFSISLAPLS